MTEPKEKRPGRWKAGESGNPAGRKPGTGEVAKLRASIAERVPELLAALMTKALHADVGAARLLLERPIAPLKAAEQPEALTLPDGSLTDDGRAVLRAAADGALAPAQGAQLLSAIGSLPESRSGIRQRTGRFRMRRNKRQPPCIHLACMVLVWGSQEARKGLRCQPREPEKTLATLSYPCRR